MMDIILGVEKLLMEIFLPISMVIIFVRGKLLMEIFYLISMVSISEKVKQRMVT